MINVQLLERTLAHIVAFPELHHQTGFFEVNEFGVSACFAGRSLLLSGYKHLLPEREGARGCIVQHPETKETVAVWHEARKILGLSKEQASSLFSSINTRHMLECKVKELLNQSDRYCDLVS